MAGDARDGTGGAAPPPGPGAQRDREALAFLATDEMGKPVTQGLGEIDKTSPAPDCPGGAASATLSPERDAGDEVEARRIPLGTVLGIMPWNLPYWQMLRSMAGYGRELSAAGLQEFTGTMTVSAPGGAR